MLIVAIAWIYVVGMAALAEALSPQGTLLGALITFTLYGVLPLAIVLYLMGTPARKKLARRRAEATAQAPEQAAAGSALPAVEPDRRGHAPGGRVAPRTPEREEP